jgi:hypothetical protein
MNTKRNRKKSAVAAIGAAIAAAAVPAALITGAGTAQAATNLDTTSDALGVTVQIQSRKPRPVLLQCRAVVRLDDREASAGVQGAVRSAGERDPQPVVSGHPDRHHLEGEGRMPRRRR